MAPSLSISAAPDELNSAPCISVASVLVLPPIPRPKVIPSVLASSAYFASASQVQVSCKAVCSGFTGYIACISSPFFLNQLIRAQGGLFWVPELVGTAIQWSFTFPLINQSARYA